MNIDLPDGIRAFSIRESYNIDNLEKKISDIFKLWGYEKIILPTIEFYDVHKKGIGQEIANQTFRIVDRYKGDILTLRIDFTAQIARYIASLQKKEFPIRLFYTGNIFRYTIPKADNLWEKRQIGIEFIGVSEIEADAEILAVASQSLKSVEIKDYQIDINNVEIFSSLKEILNLDDMEFKIFMEYIKHREIYNLKKFCLNKNLDDKLKDFITNIPKYQGDIDLIIFLKNRLKDFNNLYKNFEDLEKIYNILKEYDLTEKVVFDIGEPTEFSYYTGVVFEIFIKDFNKKIGQGGRYDSLIQKYNGKIPATGFAFDLFNIYSYLEKNNKLKENQKDYFIIDTTEDKKTAYKIAKILREKNFSVARDIIKRDINDSINFAFNNHFKNVIVITIEENQKMVYIYRGKNKIEKYKEKEILGILERG